MKLLWDLKIIEKFEMSVTEAQMHKNIFNASELEAWSGGEIVDCMF